MSKSKKTPLHLELDKAIKTGRYMVSIWYREDKELKQFRVTNDFPIKDIPLALDLLNKDLDKLTIKPEPNPLDKKTE